MKKINDIKEEVYKCSKCGLCKSVCPMYLATRNEMFSPRGRHIVLNNFFNNEKIPSKKFFKDLDICLNCNLCKEFCPSNIDSAMIFSSLKKCSKWFYIKLFFIFNYYRIFNIKKKYKPKKINSQNKVIYFEGCYNKYIDCSDRNDSIEAIEKMGFEVEKIISNCCGYKYLSNNDQNAFNQNSKKIIKNCTSELKYIICSCDACYDTLSKIYDYEFTSKLVRLDSLLMSNNIPLNTENSFSYFKPLTRKESCYIQEEITTENKKGDCTFMENFFAIKHPNLTKKIIKDKNDKNTKEFITSCNITRWGIKKIIKNKVVALSKIINHNL